MQHIPGPAAPTHSKGEMVFLDLAKSKVILFAAKSCELVIFFGCLWITLTMTTPAAAAWVGGGINQFFLTCMGFAVDAALPESWVHVVVQHIEQKKGQFRWSVAIAIAMLVLVAVNTISSIIANNDHVTIPLWVITTLIIIRLLVGICYVTVRECQSAIDRRNAGAAQTISEWQTTFEQRLTQFANEHAHMLTTINQLVDDQTHMQKSLQQVQPASPEIDQQAVIAAVIAQLETRFTTAMKRLETEVKRVSVSPAPEMGQSETAIVGPKLVPLPQRSASSRSVKQPSVERETAQTAQGETGEALDCKSTVYALLDQDNTRQVADIARVTGYPKTTVWRHWNRYHEERGTRGQARIIESETASSAANETAS